MTHISLAGEEDWPKPINDRSFRSQSVDRVRPIMRDEINYRTSAIDDATVRAIVQSKLKGFRFDRGETRLI